MNRDRPGNARKLHEEAKRLKDKRAPKRQHRRFCQDENATVVNDRWLCNCPQ